MQREVALVYSSDARPAGANGVRPGHYAPGETSGARPLPGVTEFVEEVPVSDVKAFCSATTRAGTPCKARPVGGSDICIGHTRQSAAI
tara:strand:- start:965 stop:1228 length:264 start_codon:yes stop_codon:yes gene_type:complete